MLLVSFLSMTVCVMFIKIGPAQQFGQVMRMWVLARKILTRKKSNGAELELPQRGGRGRGVCKPKILSYVGEGGG